MLMMICKICSAVATLDHTTPRPGYSTEVHAIRLVARESWCDHRGVLHYQDQSYRPPWDYGCAYAILHGGNKSMLGDILAL